jgi:hypothetical protein
MMGEAWVARWPARLTYRFLPATDAPGSTDTPGCGAQGSAAHGYLCYFFTIVMFSVSFVVRVAPG